MSSSAVYLFGKFLNITVVAPGGQPFIPIVDAVACLSTASARESNRVSTAPGFHTLMASSRVFCNMFELAPSPALRVASLLAPTSVRSDREH